MKKDELVRQIKWIEGLIQDGDDQACSTEDDLFWANFIIKKAQVHAILLLCQVIQEKELVNDNHQAT